MNNLGIMIFITSLLVTLYRVDQINAATHQQPILSQDILGSQLGHIKYAALVFRHGDRTPTWFYPTDPYKNFSWPVDLGELTNEGKQLEYNLGKYFEPRYNHLTGKHYRPHKVIMHSSYKNRCLMSAQLFLAGYFPPSGSQVWDEKLLWQPIPVDTAPAKYDNSKFRLDLPKWTEVVFPQPLTYLRGQLTFIEAEDHTVAKLNTGPLFSVIATDMLNIAGINHTIPEYIYTQPRPRPLHLFSGHDGTIVMLMRALKMYQHTNPPYGAAFGLELRSKGESYYVTAIYEHSLRHPPQVLKIPGCPGDCSLTDFMDLIKPLLPKNWDTECQIGQSR